MQALRSVRRLSAQLQSREISAVELAQACLDRILTLDGEIGAFLSVREPESVIAEAEEVDALRSRGQDPSPFAGIPIAIKDNIAVEGQPLTCASRILENYRPPYSATAVRRLQDAGLIVIGKTNMDEFGFGSSTENSAFKVTKNPRSLERVPGGTSGGSAAAVAAGMVPWAIGTDTGGSVRQPASLCGVVGMRPSYGRVSRFGLVAYASSMDQIGPLANNVEDAAALLGLITGHDPCDSTSAPEGPPDTQGEVGALRIGIPEEYRSDDCEPAIRGEVDQAIAGVESLGWRAVPVNLPLTKYALSAYYLIASVEASSNLSRYDGVRYGKRVPGRSWPEMLFSTRSENFGVEAKRRIMLGTFASSSGYYDEYYLNALRVRTMLVREFDKAFEEVDLLLSPVSPTTAWPLGHRIHDPMSMYLSDVYSVPVALAGIPAMVVPVGNDPMNLPIGLQIAGPAMGDALVVKAGRSLEQMLEYPSPPELVTPL
jgi:aspartyl-tRNA(Asn)/glutamyl-tRNA(Gln) amidotransferase subunit A